MAYRMGDDDRAQDRAYKAAGIPFAERRSFAAYRDKRAVFDRLARYTRALDIVERHLIHGAVLCAEWLPEPDNEN
jgi:hypothetical protein